MKSKYFFSTLIVAVVQYYDYYLYGLMAATLAKKFFSDTSVYGGSSQLRKAYIILAFGMLIRPLGAIILGRLGDIYGRTKILKLSLIFNSLSSLIIACTPGYEVIGRAAAFILLFCKMSINMFSSIGTDGVRLYIYENIGRDKQCFGNGLVIAATQIGSLLASMAVWLFTMEQLPDYAWRFAFVLGSVLGFMVILFVAMNETLPTDQVKSRTYDIDPLIKILQQNFGLFVLCVILAGCIGASYQFNIIFFGTYCFDLLKIVEPSQMKKYTTIAIILYMVSSIVAGIAADHYGRRRVALIAFVSFIKAIAVNTVLIVNNTMIPFFYWTLTVILPFIIIPALAFIKQAIPVGIRYRIFSLAHACGSIIISSTTPLIATSMFETTGLNWLPLVYFGIIVSTIIIVINILVSRYGADNY